MSENSEDEKWTRRSVATHSLSVIAGGIGGWTFNSMMDVFRRPLAERIGDSQVGRNPEMNVVPVEETVNDEADFALTIANTGGETADEVALYAIFENIITDHNIVRYGNEAPYPKIDIEHRQDGGVDIWIDGLPRIFEKATPIVIEFTLGKEESSAASRIQDADRQTDDDIIMYLNGRISWTFIGEREYDDPNGVYLPANPSLP